MILEKLYWPSVVTPAVAVEEVPLHCYRSACCALELASWPCLVEVVVAELVVLWEILGKACPWRRPLTWPRVILLVDCCHYYCLSCSVLAVTPWAGSKRPLTGRSAISAWPSVGI